LFVIESLHAAPVFAFNADAGSDNPYADRPASAEHAALTPKIEAAIHYRLEKLSERAQALAQVAAVIGREFALEVLAQASGLTEEMLLTSLDELWRRQVIREHGNDRYNFSHELLRATVYAGLSPLRRRTLHRRVARAIEKSGRAQTEGTAGELAYHLSLGGDLRRAGESWLAAGDHHRLLSAEAEAARDYRRAAEAFRSVGDQEQAARALMRAGLSSHSSFDFTAANQAYDDGFVLWHASRPSRSPLLAQARKTLRSHWGEPVSLDPAVGTDFASAAVITQLYSGLACHGPDLEVTPDVAAGWEVQNNGKRYVVHLRDDVFWNDGMPCTAQDFEVAWKRVLNPATASSSAPLLYDLQGARAFHTGETEDAEAVGVRALDDVTLIIDLEAPAPYFPHLLAHPAMLPIPRRVLNADLAAAENLSQFVSNGPFMVSGWKHNTELRLMRNPRYHGHWHGNLQEVVLTLNVDSAEMLRLYDANELDVVRLSGDYTMSQLNQVQRNYSGEFLSGPRLTTWHFGFDTTRPPFADPRVRRALALSCDRVRLAHGLLKGLSTPATGGFVPPGMPGHSPDIGLKFDPTEGRMLLAEAGYPDGKGFPKVTLVTDSSAAGATNFMAAEWYRHLGITIGTTALPWAEFSGRGENERLDMYYAAWRADYPDPDSFLPCGLGRQPAQWRDQDYEEVLQHARTSCDSRERLSLYVTADRLLIESAGIVPIVYGRLYLLLNPRVRRYPFSGIRPWFWSDVVIDD
jgi:oligopeptide transport system substrate-binding protein